jgi:diguanylate cyclase
MSSKPSTPEQNPADIAREAFRRLAVRRIAPTPEAYRDIYNEIAGIARARRRASRAAGQRRPRPESVLSQFATR